MNLIPEIDGFHFVSEIGRGHNTIVYMGIQEEFDRTVAIKILDSILFHDLGTIERFEKESKIIAKFIHPNIVKIIQFGKAGRYYYIVMEYLEESLRDKMQEKSNPDSQRRIPPQLALDIIDKIFEALDFAHNNNVIHRDIKPDNIMFRNDTPVLVDFGASRNPGNTSKVNPTRSGMIIGTFDYMSPEQIQHPRSVDVRTDTYSLGAVLFEMLTGKKPYESESQIELLLKHFDEPIPKLPDELSIYQLLIDKMMAKKKEHRIENVIQFRELKKLVSKTPLQPINTQIIASNPGILKEPGDINMPSTQPPNKEQFKDANGKTLESHEQLPFIHRINHILKDRNKWLMAIGIIIILTASLFFLFSPGKAHQKSKQKSSQQSSDIKIKYDHQPAVLSPSQLSELKRILDEPNKNYPTIENALQSIRKYKTLRRTKKQADELLIIEKQLRDSKRELDREFSENLNKAYDLFTKKKYFKARIYIEKAKQIKSTEELKNLELSIDNQLK